jgi:hypothetical protein
MLPIRTLPLRAGAVCAPSNASSCLELRHTTIISGQTGRRISARHILITCLWQGANRQVQPPVPDERTATAPGIVGPAGFSCPIPSPLG